MSKPILIASGIYRNFKSGEQVLEVLKGVDLSVSPADFLGITGPSGAGKSTLLHIMGGLDRPDRGDVFIDEHNLLRLNRRQLARTRNRKIGFIFQFFHLLPEFTALENVMLPALIRGLDRRRAVQCRAGELLDLVGLASRSKHFPTQLSGGEQQRVAVARALINQPVLLLADEPTGNVDSKTSRMIMELLRRINRELGQATVVVSHDPEIGEWVDRQVHMRDGYLE